MGRNSDAMGLTFLNQCWQEINFCRQQASGAVAEETTNVQAWGIHKTKIFDQTLKLYEKAHFLFIEIA